MSSITAPLSPTLYLCGDDPEQVAERASRLSGAQTPPWRRVAGKVSAAVATALCVAAGIAAAIALGAACATFSAAAGLVVGNAAFVAALIGGVVFAAWVWTTPLLHADPQKASDEANRILKAFVTQRHLDAFLKVAHLCRELDLMTIQRGVESGAEIIEGHSPLKKKLGGGHAVVADLLDEWLGTLPRTYATSEIINALRSWHLAPLIWYAPPVMVDDTAAAMLANVETTFEQACADGVYSADDAGRRRFVMDNLPNDTQLQSAVTRGVIAKSLLLQALQALTDRCTTVALPSGFVDDTDVVAALQEKGFATTAQTPWRYRRGGGATGAMPSIP